MTDSKLYETSTDRYPSTGDVLDGKYRIEGIVNTGGMGVIMRAHQLNMERDVALKLLLPDKVERERTRVRFEREVHLAKQLTHPNVIRFYDFGNHGRFLYIVMELLEGEDLKAVLRRVGRLSVARALDITIQIADALSEAHRRNIVHRDLKPANVFIVRLGSQRDFVKVLDFGIAKSLDSGEFDVTNTGEVSGTLAYLSPEAVRGRKPGKASDVYALGVLFLQMVTGRKVFEGHNAGATLMNHLQKPLELPPTLLNTPVAAVLERAMSKDPEERYGNASEMLAALNRLVPVVSPSMRVPENEVFATYGPEIDAPGASSSEVVPAPSDSLEDRSAGTEPGYAVRGAADRAGDAERRSSSTLDPRELGIESGPSVWVILAVVVLFALAGAIGGKLFFGTYGESKPAVEAGPESMAPATEPEPEPEPAAVSVTLRTTPLGAEVFRSDGTRLGATPLSLPLQDTTVIELRLEGHETHSAIIDPLGITEYDFALTPIADAVAADAGADETDRDAGAAQETTEKAARSRPLKSERARRPVRKKRQRIEASAATEKKEGEQVEQIDVFGTAPEVESEPEPPTEKTPAELHAEAKKAFVAGDYGESVALCKKALARGEDSCNALLATAYRQLGRQKKACRYYEAAGIAHKSCISLQSR